MKMSAANIPGFVKQECSGCSYGIFYMMSELIMCRLSEQRPEYIDYEECLEARLFGEDKEIHLFRKGEDWEAVITSEDKPVDHIDRCYRLGNRYKSFGTTLLVREYVDYDEDGQAYIYKTRLTGVS